MAAFLARLQTIPVFTRTNLAIITRSASTNQSGAGKKSEKSPNKESKPLQSSEPKLTKGVDPPAHVFQQADGPVGPGASKTSDYKNPEYFQYHEVSFHDMEVVMAKFRLPQPSAKTLS